MRINLSKNNLRSFFPEIAKEWHPTKNGNLKPEEVSKGSGIKVWWICLKNKKHEWKTSVANRTNFKSSTHCPFCSGRRVSSFNSLKLLFPNLAKEWHPTKNGNLKPENVARGSSKKAWWLCSKGHEWYTQIINRTKGGGCPHCIGRRLSNTNNLKFANPDLAKEWHPTKNGNLKPEHVFKSSGKKVWWVCSKGHEWITKVLSRSHGTGCPYCSGKKVGEDNNLKFLFPDLAKEWHPTKNGNLKPEHIFKSSNKKVWWLCANGHEWLTKNSHRVSSGSNCPKCSNQSSKAEFRILAELEKLFKKVQSRFKYKKAEIDIYINDINVGIEYDGSYFHKRKDSDEKKNKYLKNLLIELIRVREKPLEKISDFDIIVEKDELTKNDLNKIIYSIINFCDEKQIELLNKYLKHKTFINEEAYRKYLSYFPAPIPSNSLAVIYPELIKEWNYKKNYPLVPESFFPLSGTKVWWLCSEGHEWFVSPGGRNRKINGKLKRTGCPYCAGRKVSKENNLKFLNPSLAKEWHPTKNGELKPEEVTRASGRKVWWLCAKGHEWDTKISNRSKGKGCPYCSNHYPSLFKIINKNLNK